MAFRRNAFEIHSLCHQRRWMRHHERNHAQAMRYQQALCGGKKSPEGAPPGGLAFQSRSWDFRLFESSMLMRLRVRTATESAALEAQIDQHVRAGLNAIDHNGEMTEDERANERREFIAAQTSRVEFRDHLCNAWLELRRNRREDGCGCL